MKKIHRFFYNFKIKDNIINIDDFEIVNQIRNVLKLKINEKFIIFFNNNEVLCSIRNINKKFINCDVLKNNFLNKDNKEIILCCAILKKDNFELIVQKSAEIGISKIIPVITERTIKTNLNFDRLNKISKEACEQAERKNIMEINEIKNLKDCFNIKNDINIFFDFSGEDLFKKKICKKNKSILFFIGPEGGFTDQEVNLAKKNNFIIARLGDNVLRGETAAIIASYLLVNC